MNIQIDVDVKGGRQAGAEEDKPRQVGALDAALDWVHEFVFSRSWAALIWVIIAAAMFYLAAHVIWAFARGWFPVGP